MTAKNLLPYSVSGLFIDRNDVRAHGRDERLLVKSFYQDYGVHVSADQETKLLTGLKCTYSTILT